MAWDETARMLLGFMLATSTWLGLGVGLGVRGRGRARVHVGDEHHELALHLLSAQVLDEPAHHLVRVRVRVRARVRVKGER